MDGSFTTPEVTLERIKKYLAKNKRFDGRAPEEYRELTIETGFSKNAEGSARVKLGNTEVIAGVKMDVSTPYADSPDKGNFMVTAEFLPLSSKRFETGPPRINSIELARVTDRAIRESKVIQFDKLCIEVGEKVWTVFVDIYTINADGNLMDAAGIAAMTALMNATIPKYDNETGKVIHGESSGKKLPLSKDIPLSITVHKIGNSLLVDPTQEEEDASEARITIGSSNGIISSGQKGEAGTFSVEEFGKALNIIENSWKKIFKIVEEATKD